LDPLILFGTPKVFDTFLRLPARFVHVTLGGIATLLLFYFGYFWAAPLPFALGFVWYEWFFWSRGDRPFELSLHPDGRVEIHEPFKDRRWGTDLSKTRSATVVYRATEDGRHDCVAFFCDERAVQLAIQFRVREFEPRPEDVNADLWDAVFGGLSGLIRTLSPRETLIRQVFEDGRGLAWLRAAVPAGAWDRTGLRVWQGEAPEIDLFGYHAEDPTGLITLDGDSVAFWNGEETTQHAIGPLVMARSSRQITLFRMWGEDSEERDEDVPMLLVDLGPLTAAIPAPTAGQTGELRELHADLLHMHAPEGAALVWHLLRDRDRDTWPAALEEWVQAGEAFVEAST